MGWEGVLRAQDQMILINQSINVWYQTPIKLYKFGMYYYYYYHRTVVGSYCSLIFNYLCSQYLSPLKLWVWIPLMARCSRCNIIWSILSVLCGRSVIFYGYSAFPNWPPLYNWNIGESGFKRHNPNPSVFEHTFYRNSENNVTLLKPNLQTLCMPTVW